MTNFKKLILTICATAVPAIMMAQFDSQRSQYMYSASAYNPGAIAQNDMCNLLGIYRLQWAGFTGAPTDIVVSADMPLTISGTKHGLGLNFQKESIGLFENQAFNLQYAYQMHLWRGQLGLGLSLGMISQSFDESGVSIDGIASGNNSVTSGNGDDYHKTDNALSSLSDQNDMAFDASFGAYYSDESLYLGFSVLNLIKPKFEFGDNGETDIPRLFYLVGGYDMPLSNEDYHFKPSALFRTDFSSTQLDLSCRLDYRKRFIGGLGYRLGDSFEFLVGANLLNGLFLGYAYDLPVSGMIRSGGSHEVCLKYSFKLEFAKKNKYKSERIL